MQAQNISNICNAVTTFFTQKSVQISKDVHFVQRKSKLDAKLFSETLVVGCLSDNAISLEHLCRLLNERGITITKQGLQQRFSPQAAVFMQRLFDTSLEQFKTENKPIIEALACFTGVVLTDSSAITLPDTLKDVYKGCGGGRTCSRAGLKIQVMLNYLQGQLIQTSLTSGCQSDHRFKGCVDNLTKGTLYLQDLGYFNVASFAKIQAQKAYFVSRYLAPTALFTKEGESIALLPFLRQAGSVVEKTVTLGRKDSLEVRFIAFRLDEQQIEKRLARIHKNCQKQGRTASQTSLELAKWSIYITNVPANMLSTAQVHLVYTLRWQIELFFKLCKSDAGLNTIGGRKSERVLCEIYAKLIGIVQLLYVCFPCRWQENREVSYHKAYKLFKQNAHAFFIALTSPYRLAKFMKMFLNDIIQFARKDKYRKTRPSTSERLMASSGQVI